MSDLTSSNFSETDASNDAAPPNGWPEGMNPSDVNNSARATHGALKRWFNRTSMAYTAGGGTTAYTLTPSVALAAYALEIWSWKMPSANAVDATMNISGLGARNIRKLTAAGYVNVAAGDLPSGAYVQAIYNTTDNKFDLLSVVPTLSTLVAYQSAPSHRLSLTTATAVTTSDVTGGSAGTVFWVPGRNNLTPIYTGTTWTNAAIAELSFILDAANMLADKNFDVLLDYNSGTPRLVLSPAWTNATTRADALGLDATYGYLMNNASMTVRLSNNGGTATLAAKNGLYLGTIRTAANGQTEDSLAKRFVWNMFNRVPRAMRVVDATDSWTYATGTIRQANGSAANQLDFVRGLDEDAASATVLSRWANDTVGQAGFVAIGLDSTTTPATGCLMNGMQAAVANSGSVASATWNGMPGVGRHFLAWLERGSGSGTQNWGGDAGVTYVQSGISGGVIA